MEIHGIKHSLQITGQMEMKYADLMHRFCVIRLYHQVKYGHKESIENLLGDRFDELNYKMSMEKYVNNDTPQTFIWHCFDDETVPVENSLMFATALRQHNIPTELHVFAGGAHGIGTAGELTMSSDGYGVVKECECWMDLANAWIRNI